MLVYFACFLPGCAFVASNIYPNRQRLKVKIASVGTFSVHEFPYLKSFEYTEPNWHCWSRTIAMFGTCLGYYKNDSHLKFWMRNVLDLYIRLWRGFAIKRTLKIVRNIQEKRLMFISVTVAMMWLAKIICLKFRFKYQTPNIWTYLFQYQASRSSIRHPTPCLSHTKLDSNNYDLI